MAEVEGESQIYTDLRMKLYIDQDELIKEYESSPEWLKRLMDSFADGANWYLHTHPEVTPKLLTRFEPWMALAFSEGSIGGDIEQISTRGLESFYGGESLLSSAVKIADDDLEPRGSNGFAISPTLSANGNALLLINPHTSFFFRSEVHMVSEEGLNAYGAVTWGQFFIYQGFNQNCGWMHTSSKADAIDYYLETVEEVDGKYFYKYGDELKPFEERIITVPYKDGDMISEKSFTAYFSHHGPVIRDQDGKWITISLMVEHEKALTQSYMRTKANSYDEFKKTMDLNTNSSNNTVYADGDGNIAYFHGNFVPVRDQSFNWAEPVDGSNPDTDWKGLHTVEEMILIKNPENGWIQNCNSTPFTASDKQSPKPEDYPSYMAPDEENARGLHAVMVLRGQSDFTVDKLIEVAYDSYLPAFENTIPALVAAYDKLSAGNSKLKSELGGAIEVLREWDFRFSATSVPTSLAIYWGEKIIMKTRSSESRRPGVSVFDYISTEVEPAVLLESLRDAMGTLKENFGTWEVPWGDINRYQRLNGDIVQPFNDSEPSLPVAFASSRWGSLASFGSRTYPGTKKMYGTSGNSFVAAVEFGDRVVAKSILAGGVSGDPQSKHFDDQAQMYANGEFKDVLFYLEDIEANSLRRYNPGK
jgi:acyl-homoserine lactone acylase PvdQ